jgi:hypothetical protein
MLQAEASTSAFDYNPNELQSQHRKPNTVEKRGTKMVRSDYSIHFIVFTLFLMAQFGQAEASFKNNIKAPDELFQVSWFFGYKIWRDQKKC